MNLTPVVPASGGVGAERLIGAGGMSARGTVKPRVLPSCCDPAGMFGARKTRTTAAWPGSLVGDVRDVLWLCAV